MPSSLASLLTRGVHAVEQTPFCAEGMRRALSGLTVAVCVDEEVCLLSAGADRIFVHDGRPGLRDVPVHISTRGTVLLDVLADRVDLLEALRTNALRVRGSAVRLAELSEATKHFVEGCARSRNGPQLLRDLRDAFGEGEEP